jgi:hypothetical protein
VTGKCFRSKRAISYFVSPAQRLITEEKKITAVSAAEVNAAIGSPLTRGRLLSLETLYSCSARIIGKLDRVGETRWHGRFKAALKEAKIGAVLGWMDDEIQDNYTHWQAEDLRQWAEIVDGIWDESE